MQPAALITWLLFGVALMVFASRVRTAWLGWPLLLAGLAVFGVRLHHEGPYPFPGALDLSAGVAALLVGLLLIRSPWSRSGSDRASPVTRILLGTVPVVFAGALLAYGHEAEEVVTLRTVGPEGQSRETRLWIVDHAGSPWIVTGSRSAHVRDLTANPRVAIDRAGASSCWTAERHSDRETLETVLEARSQKYLAQRIALATGLWAHFTEREDLPTLAVALRFSPCDE